MATNPQPQPPPPAPPPPPPQPPPPPPGPGAGAGGAGGAGAGAGDPQLVAMIVNHLKSQGLFDQFRRDCLADVDTKPAYQNLRQRVDNFVANHLATHTWSPHLNKNQLRNNIRQQVLKSGMLESGIDRIISQVVDPKINHTFRPQVEKAVHEFLATLSHKEEASGSSAPSEEKPDSAVSTPGIPAPGPSANVANDAMSILETITSLNQEASAARASTEMSNAKTSERVSKRLPSQPSADTSTERERASEDVADKEKSTPDAAGEGQDTAPKAEEVSDLPCPVEEIKNHTKESNSAVLLNKDVQQESSDQKNKSTDKGEKKPDINEKGERKKEKKEKTEKKFDHSKRSEDTQKVKDEKQAKDKEVECSKLPSEKNSNKAKPTEGTKEDCSVVESDVDGLTDITVSSVHTSDLSSFEEDTEEEVVMSDSMEEGEITSDDEEKDKQNKTKTQTSDPSEGKAKSGRHAYVHKPYLYSKYYSDSDDELTVEQRRQSIAKEKEERLLRRQINREKLEEKRKQKAEKTKSSKAKSQGKNSVDLEESSTKSLEPKTPRIKEVLKERKVLEKKVALSKKRKKDSRNVEENSKKKQHAEEDSKETLKISEHCEKEKVSSSKEVKHAHTKSEPSKPTRRLSESLHSADENKSESKVEREHKRRTSTPVVVEGAPEETDTRDGRKLAERSETGPEEPQKPKGALKNEKHLKKDDSETPHVKNPPKKEAKSSKEKPEKERTLSEDRLSTKHKHKGDGVHKTGDETEPHSSERGLKVEESVQKQGQQTKPSADDKAERKSKHRNERKLSVLGKDGKPVSEYIIKTDENVRKENNKKERHLSTEKPKAEHRSRRSSDSKIQKESLTSKQHGVTLQRRSESYSEEKCDTDAANLDSSSKPEEVVHKEKRRAKSLVEEKLGFKSKSKSQGKQLKASEAEFQEGISKQTAAPKAEKEKNTEENDPDRQRKPKVEDRSAEDTAVESVSEGAASSAHSSQKDSSHRAKPPLAKEKHKGDKDASSSRPERRLSDGHKSRSLKHSGKDVRKKDEGKPEEGKEVDSNHEKARGASSVVEKKVGRRSCENRKGSLSQEVTKGEERLAANAVGAPSSSSLQRPKRSGDTTLIPEQEPMEIDSEPVVENALEVSKTQESSSQSSQQDVDAENTKQRTTATPLKDELRTSTVDAKPAAPGCKSGRGAGVVSNSEKHADHKSTLTKKVPVQSAVCKLNPGEKEPTQQGTDEVNTDSETSQRMSPRAPSENERVQKNSKITRPTEEHVAQEDAVLEHSTNLDPSPSSSSVTVVPQKQSCDSDVIPVVDKRRLLEGGTASTSLAGHLESPNQSLTVRGSEVPRTSDSKEGGAVSTADTPAKASTDGKRHIPESCQAATLHSKQGKEFTDVIMENENVSKEGGLLAMARKDSGVSTEPTSKQTVRTAVDNGRKDATAADHALRVRAEGDADPQHSRGPGEVGTVSVDTERRSENSEVDTSARSNTASSALHQRNGQAETVAAGSPGAGKTSVATSTEGRARGMALDPVKAGSATTTSSEAGAGPAAVPCTSEADEGLITGVSCGDTPLRAGPEASECTVFAAAEEGGGVVTEGLAESETVLTSTKEGESGECTLAGSEDRAAGPVPAQAVPLGDSVNSAVTEEKDDAVTSAGSEEKCDGSSSRDSDIVGGTVTFTGEVESDGAVTSAGTEIREGSLSSEELDGFQRNVTRLGPKKEPEGTVTCTGAEGRSDSFVMCSVTGVGPQEERMVTGAAVVLVDSDTPPGTSATQEGDGSVNDGTEGESAVTSTGITEEDGEGPASCTGSEESSEGFALSSESEETGERAMDSTGAKEVTDAPSMAAGPCDDEGIVTSTGAKEEDDEGEGVVTSTGRGNEVGHTSACTGTEEESEGVSICESAEEGDSPVGTAGGHAAAEAGAAITHVHESNVDSMSGAEKEVKDPEICSSAKGVVESSVTSAACGKGEVAPEPEGCEGPMTSATSGSSDSQLTRKENADDTTISTGLVGGSYEALVSGAVPEYQVHHTLPSDKEGEGVITSVENEECDGLAASTASDRATNQTCLAGDKSLGVGLMISTSTPNGYSTPLSTMVDVAGERPSALSTEGDVGGPGVLTEDFEAPMPSAVSGDASQATAAIDDKDECAMISTSIEEELQVPVSSAATVTCAGSQPSVAAIGGRAKGPDLVSADDFEVPMPSAHTEVGSPHASTSKEDRDDGVISTSIAEECEASVSGAAVASAEERSATAAEEKDGSAVISTSSGEDCEGPVSSAAPQEQVRPSATAAEEMSDTAMISTSTSEGREAVMRGADQPPAARMEDASDAALISTSTAESVLVVTGLDRHEDNLLTVSAAAGKDDPSLTKESKREVPMPSLMAENSRQGPGAFTGRSAVGPEEGRDPASASAPSAGGRPEEGGAPGSPVPGGDQSPKAGTAGGSTTASRPTGSDSAGAAGSPDRPSGPEQPCGRRTEHPSVTARALTTEHPSVSARSPTTEHPSVSACALTTERPSVSTCAPTTEHPSVSARSPMTGHPSVSACSPTTEHPSISTHALTTEHAPARTHSPTTEHPSITVRSLTTEPPSISTHSLTTEHPSVSVHSLMTEHPSVSIHALTAESAHAKVADDTPRGRDTAAGQSCLPRDGQEPEDTLQPPTTEGANGQEAAVTPSHPAPSASRSEALTAPVCEQDPAATSNDSGKWTAQASTGKAGHGLTESFQKGDLEVTVSSEENSGDIGNEESPLDVLGGLERKANLRTETLLPSEDEAVHGIPAPSESPRGRKRIGIAELQREPLLVNESLNVKNSSPRANEEIPSKRPDREEIPHGRKDNTEAVRGHSVEASPKEVEEEKHMPKRKRKKHYPSSDDELDDAPDVLDSRTEAAPRQSCDAEPPDAKEQSSGDLAALSKTSPNTSTTALRAMEEKDECSSSEATGDKTEQDDDNPKSQEEDQPVIIKRKRGRPRKHPVETALKTRDDSKTDAGIITVEQSPPGGRLKAVQTDESSKETSTLQERSVSNDEGDEKTVASVRRRGRKPKRSLTLSDDAESSEPERKRQKSVSEAAEDKKEQESDEEEEEEEEEEPPGATTRSASRSEAQRSKAQLSPSTKRKREASPPGARTRGQQRVEEAPGKKAKR